MWKLSPPSVFKFLATPQPALVVGEENLVIGFGPPHFRNASAIAECSHYKDKGTGQRVRPLSIGGPLQSSITND